MHNIKYKAMLEYFVDYALIEIFPLLHHCRTPPIRRDQALEGAEMSVKIFLIHAFYFISTQHTPSACLCMF